MTAPAHDGLIAGRYQLVAPIGSGANATVYRGLDLLLDREVAVKQPIVAPAVDAGMRAEAVKRIIRQARAAAKISHPGVAAIYEVVPGEDSPYIVMELIDGRSLAELLVAEGPLAPHRVAGIGRQVLAALVAGHIVGVLHRDLKPGNVMITSDEQAVLTDFGIAVTVDDPSVVAGTPGFTAPERASGMPATAAADRWSLGATLYAALSGHGPFDDREDATATPSAIAGQDPPHLNGDGSLYEIVNALLRRDPAERPTFHEIALALDVAAANVPVLAGPPTAVDLSSGTGTGRPPGLRNLPAAQAPVPPRFRQEQDAAAAAPVPPAAPVPAAGALAASSLAEPSHPVPARPRTAGHQYGEPGPASRTASASHGKGGAGRADRLGKSTIVTVAALVGLSLAALVVGALVPGPNHGAQTPPAPAQSSPGPGPSSPAAGQSSPVLAGPPAPPPVGQQFRVAAAANADGTPEVVALARSGALIASRFINGSWSAWTTLPGGPAYTGDPAVVSAKDGRLIVFARAKTGQVAEIWQPSPESASWKGPVALGTTITRSSPAVVAWPDGHLEVFALLTDARTGYASQASTSGGGTWTGWTSLGGTVTGPPAVALDATGHPQVFAATAGRLLVHDYFLNGTWAGWAQVPGSSRYVGVPGIAVNADGRLEVFARSTNGDLLHVWQLSRTGTRWGGPGNLAKNGCSTDPAAFSAVNGEHGGHLEAFCMDSTFGLSVFHAFQLSPTAGGPWSPWQSLKGSSDGAVTALQTPKITEILTRTASGAIAYETWTAQHGWSAWSMLPASPALSAQSPEVREQGSIGKGVDAGDGLAVRRAGEHVDAVRVQRAVRAVAERSDGRLAVGTGHRDLGLAHPVRLGQEADDGVAAGEPGQVRRHLQDGVPGEQPGEPVDVRGYPRRHVPVDQRALGGL
jgi:tRNA A-37 threonylcarbamoyl transferase component Bud32